LPSRSTSVCRMLALLMPADARSGSTCARRMDSHAAGCSS
jgi:hypothetical protein